MFSPTQALAMRLLVLVCIVPSCWSDWVIGKQRVVTDVYVKAFDFDGICTKIKLHCDTSSPPGGPPFQKLTCDSGSWPTGYDGVRAKFAETVCTYIFRGMAEEKIKWILSKDSKTEWTKDHCIEYVKCAMDKICKDTTQRLFDKFTGDSPGGMQAVMTSTISLKAPKDYNYGSFTCN